MITYALYDTNGEFFQSGTTEESLLPLYEKELNCSSVIGNFDININYFKDGEVLPKPQMEIILSNSNINANGEDVCVISGIPKNAKLVSEGIDLISNGEDVEFITDIIGEHKIKITLFPYMNKEIIIYAI